jgi:uncharacterized protein YjgD (DUF1641 family)
MNEALILEKLDNLSSEISSLKSEVQALKDSKAAAVTEEASTAVSAAMQKHEGKYSEADLANLVENLLDSVNDINSLLFKVKAANELARDIEPVAQVAYPQVMKFFSEIEDQVSIEELTGLLRNLLTSLNAINEGVSMLKMGVELRDELIPVAQLGYPKLVRFLNDLHQGEFQSEQIGTLLHTLLLNLHTLSDLLNMAKPFTELVQELQVVIRETDVIHNINTWLDSLQQSSGIYKLAGTAIAGAKQFSINPEQAEEISQVLQNIDFNNIEPVTPFGAIKHLRDPKIQEALGAMFMMLQATGACLQVIQDKQQKAN